MPCKFLGGNSSLIVSKLIEFGRYQAEAIKVGMPVDLCQLCDCGMKAQPYEGQDRMA